MRKTITCSVPPPSLSTARGRRLAGLAKLFAQKGQGEAMNSWIGTGKNLPISPEAILGVLGQGRIQELAGKLGMSNLDVEKDSPARCRRWSTSSPRTASCRPTTVQ